MHTSCLECGQDLLFNGESHFQGGRPTKKEIKKKKKTENKRHKPAGEGMYVETSCGGWWGWGGNSHLIQPLDIFRV